MKAYLLNNVSGKGVTGASKCDAFFSTLHECNKTKTKKIGQKILDIAVGQKIKKFGKNEDKILISVDIYPWRIGHLVTSY